MKINRYMGNTGRVTHVHETHSAPPGQRRRPVSYSPGSSPSGQHPEHNSRHDNNTQKKPPSGAPAGGSKSDGISGILKSILPKGAEFGDVLILAVFLFLYIESKDTDFLIILIVLAFSFFKDSQVLSELPLLSGLSSLFRGF